MIRIEKTACLILLCPVLAFGAGPDTFFAVHCEPTHVSQYEALVRMVMLADSFDARLTIQFTPQWADTILSTPALLAQVRGWQAAGHEIAAHHHSLDYKTGWDGYTNHPESDIIFPDLYRGTMQDFFDLLSLLAGDSLLLTGCITDHFVDWPAGIPYRNDGHMMAEALTQPQSLILNGQPVTSLGFGLINTPARVDSAKALFLSGTDDDVLGVVLHESNFDDDPRNMRNWLKFLATRGTVKTVRTILRERGFVSEIKNDQDDYSGSIPEGFHLEPIFPNPFNGRAVISFLIPNPAHVMFSIHGVDGRRALLIPDGLFNPGRHEILLDADGFASGMYLVVLHSGGFRLTRKMMVMK